MEKTVDGYRFLPPGLAAWIDSRIPPEDFQGPIPWTPLSKPLARSRVALVTSAGIRLKSDPPFDMEREKREPTWGDPTHRTLPKETTEADIDIHHLHINTDYARQDLNVILPLSLMQALQDEGVIGALADTAYAFYGFQWEKTDFLDEAIAPMIAGMKAEAVDAVLLTPA